MNRFARRLLRQPQGAIGGALLMVLFMAVLLGPSIAPYDPETFTSKYG